MDICKPLTSDCGGHRISRVVRSPGKEKKRKTEWRGETTSKMHEHVDAESLQSGVVSDIPWLRRWDAPSAEEPDDVIDFMNMLEELEFK